MFSKVYNEVEPIVNEQDMDEEIVELSAKSKKYQTKKAKNNLSSDTMFFQIEDEVIQEVF